MFGINNGLHDSVPLHCSQEERNECHESKEVARQKRKSCHEKDTEAGNKKKLEESSPNSSIRDETTDIDSRYSTDTDNSNNEENFDGLLTQPNDQELDNAEREKTGKKKKLNLSDSTSVAEHSNSTETRNPIIIADDIDLIYNEDWRDKNFLVSYVSKRIFNEDLRQSSSPQCPENISRTSIQNSENDEEAFFRDSRKSIAIEQICKQPKKKECFSLSTLCITRIWETRDCNIIHTFREDNGPLEIAYKSVLSIEVMDASNSIKDERTSTATFMSLRIYFYDDYADKLSGILSNNTCLYLKNIPATCVFPNIISEKRSNGTIANKQSLLSSVSICIGSKSKMKHNQKSKIRFDDGVVISWKNTEKEMFKMNAATLKEPGCGFVVVSQHDKRGYEENNYLDSALTSKQRPEIRNESCANVDNSLKLPMERPGHLSKMEAYLQNVNFQQDSYRIENQEYHSLRALRTISAANYHKRRLNCFAIVLSSTAPTITSRGDMFMSLTITDDSFQKSDEVMHKEQIVHGLDRPEMLDAARITLNIFFEKGKEKLPFCMAGDAVRCHRISIREWNGNLQLVAQRYSSFLVVRPKQPNKIIENSINSCRYELKSFREHWETMKVSKTITFNASHGKRFHQLWIWGQNRLCMHPTLFKQDQKCTISQLETSSVILEAEKAAGLEKNRNPHIEVVGDMTVMITDIIPTVNMVPNSPRGFLRVWDGTGAPMTDVHPITGNPITHYELSRGLLRSTARAAYQISKHRLNEPSIPPPKYFTGRIINVAIWELPHWNVVCGQQNDGDNEDLNGNSSHFDKFKVGKFIRLRNVKDGLILNNIRSIMVNSKSSMTILPETTFEVRTLLLNHQKQIEQEYKCNPNSDVEATEICSTSDHDDGNENIADFSTLRNNISVQEGLQYNTIDICLGDSMNEYGDKIFTSTIFPIIFRVQSMYPELKVIDAAIDGKLSGLRSFCIPVLNGFESNFEDRTNESKKTTDFGMKSFLFQFSVTIYDETAELDALVCNSEAEKLLGVTADDIYTSLKKGSYDLIENIPATNARAACRKKFHQLMDGTWTGTLKSLICNEVKYYLLESCTLHELDLRDCCI